MFRFETPIERVEPEDGGKPPIERVPGSEYEVPCDTLIYAIGQTRTLEILPDGVELANGPIEGLALEEAGPERAVICYELPLVDEHAFLVPARGKVAHLRLRWRLASARLAFGPSS